MKHEYAAALVAVVVVTLCRTVAGQGTPVASSPDGARSGPKHYRFTRYATEQPTVLSLGPYVELRGLSGTEVNVTASRAHFDTATRTTSASEAAIGIAAGTNLVSVRADEVRWPVTAGSAQQQVRGERMFMLKSGGVTLAELRVPRSASVAVENADSSGHSEYNSTTGTVLAKGGAILKLTTGTTSISARADEIASLPDAN